MNFSRCLKHCNGSKHFSSPALPIVLLDKTLNVPRGSGDVWRLESDGQRLLAPSRAQDCHRAVSQPRVHGGTEAEKHSHSKGALPWELRVCVCVCVCVCVYLLSLEHHTWWWLCLIEGGWQELGSSLENIGNKNIHFCNV